MVDSPGSGGLRSSPDQHLKATDLYFDFQCVLFRGNNVSVPKIKLQKKISTFFCNSNGFLNKIADYQQAPKIRPWYMKRIYYQSDRKRRPMARRVVSGCDMLIHDTLEIDLLRAPWWLQWIFCISTNREQRITQQKTFDSFICNTGR